MSSILWCLGCSGSAQAQTRMAVTLLAEFWILLLVTATDLKQNTWFLLVIGSMGMLQNIYVAGWKRSPKAFGVPLNYQTVVGRPKVMDTLSDVEEAYPRLGRSMLDTFFPGKLRTDEEKRWAQLEGKADAPAGSNQSPN